MLLVLLFIGTAVQLLFQWLRQCIISKWEQLLHALHHLKLINLCLCECKWVLSLSYVVIYSKKSSFREGFNTKSKNRQKKVLLRSCIISITET